MDSKEFGLVAAQQLLAVESLHYGFWEAGETPTLAALPDAQARHTDFLLKHVEEVIGDGPALDSGCGSGLVIRELCGRGYTVDGLVPSAWMAARAREHTAPFGSTIHECGFEDLPVLTLPRPYSLVYFSESFQYVRLQDALSVLTRCLVDHGHVVIFDFFKRDGVPGKSPLGGGHSLAKFYEAVATAGFAIKEDLDVTEHLSPNLDLVQELIQDRLVPFSRTLDSFLTSRYRVTYGLARWLLRKRIDKLSFKYSEARNGENFARYKSYRLIVLERG